MHIRAFLISFELVMGSQQRLFVHQVDFILLFSPPCLENRTFWIPAFARMTDYQAAGRHQRPVTSLSPVTCHL